MAKNSKHNRRKQKMTIPLAIVAGFASPIGRSIQHGQAYGITGPEGAIAEFTRTMLGFNPYASQMAFESWRLKYGLWPVLAGFVVHWLASQVGINRMLSRSGIPMIRI